MRQLRYGVAVSLDGYIAGPNGEADWNVIEAEINFGAIFTRFDTLFMGRKTYETMVALTGERQSIQSLSKISTVFASGSPPKYFASALRNTAYCGQANENSVIDERNFKSSGGGRIRSI